MNDAYAHAMQVQECKLNTRVLQGLFGRGCARACLMGIAPEPSGDPKGVGRGVFFVREPLDPRLNILVC